MDAAIHVLAFAGSLRTGSLNRALLRAAVELAPEGLTLETLDLRPIPLYDGDVEAAGLPEPVQRLRARIAAADGLLIATPEYNSSIPGVLKNAIDWASRPPDQPCAGKPLATLGATPGGFGTVRAQAHLRQVCAALGMLALPTPELRVSAAQERIDAGGRLTDDATRQALRGLLDALADWIRRLGRR